MNKIGQILSISLLLIIVMSCKYSDEAEGNIQSAAYPITAISNSYDKFSSYWYQGEAEISSYQLEQARYGEVHPGHAVLVFVTEDFSKSKQVKLDFSAQAGDDKVAIMKLNFVKKFNTGVYPYSMMQSVFSPVEVDKYPHALKTSMSSQEWCGHTFTQFNLKKKSYQIKGLSYFESEGDIEEEIPLTWLEDEIWTRIRINPQTLPLGTVQMIPGSFYLRLRHRDLKAETADISILSSEENPGVATYKIYYPRSGRTLSINFEKAFPHQILGWEEQYKSGFGNGASSLKTKASLMKNIKSAYWNQHKLSDSHLRQELGLE